jgi:hypothetical protein
MAAVWAPSAAAIRTFSVLTVSPARAGEVAAMIASITAGRSLSRKAVLL